MTAGTDDAKLIWAAYVLGHHGYSARYLQEWYWLSRDAGQDPDLVIAVSERLPGQLKELDEAVYSLGISGTPTAAVQIELRRALDRLSRLCRRMIEGEFPESPRPLPPGRKSWLRLREASERVFDRPSPGEPLYRLGAAFGEFEYDLAGWSRHALESRDGSTPPLTKPGDLGEIARRADEAARHLVAIELREIARELRLTVASFQQEYGSPSQHFYPFRGEALRCLWHFDEACRSTLRPLADRRPLVELTAEKVRILDTTFDVGNRFNANLAVLWVLAERTGEPVERDILREQSGTRREERDLPQIVAQLRRRYLSPAIAAFYGGADPPDEDRRPVIRGHERRDGIGGPYELDLGRHEVRIAGPRPAWMPSRP